MVDAQPTEAEKPVWNQVQERLLYAQTILLELHHYKGATNEIRQVGSFCSLASS